MDRPFSIVCPHCDAEQDLASAEVSYGDGDVSEMKCDNCGKTFFCECTVMCFVNYPHTKGCELLVFASTEQLVRY